MTSTAVGVLITGLALIGSAIAGEGEGTFKAITGGTAGIGGHYGTDPGNQGPDGSTGRSLDEVNLTNERVTALAAAEGLAYDFGRYTVVNTLDAHRVDVGTAPRRDRSEGAGSASGGGLGLVAGGRVALLQAIPTLAPVELVGDEAVGLGILRRALEAPIRQIADIAGEHRKVIVEQVKTLPRAGSVSPGHGHAFARARTQLKEPGRTSGQERDRTEPCEGCAERDRPRPAGRQVQGPPTGRTGDPTGEAEQPTAERLGRQARSGSTSGSPSSAEASLWGYSAVHSESPKPLAYPATPAGWPGASANPSCWSMLSRSCTAQCSTWLPFANRTTWTEAHVADLPDGGMPPNSPFIVPWVVVRRTTLSPSAITSSIVAPPTTGDLRTGGRSLTYWLSVN